eukprot:CAMPEP_0119431760 /NCGR_PEP_ID=MMETSP1335-20130426/46530_1 /TAXON_ID=259385 /ORGANISM="Chrysoculter rhomboideus, Strain RCC1486" /LENGTH=459 /DNA_ID=CAMNT_0007457567 /DNA_START=31 /DNA_END=1407 /DNA_ORIENTATION=+
MTAGGDGSELPVIRNLDTGEVIQLDEADTLWKPRQSSRGVAEAGAGSASGDAPLVADAGPFLMSGYLWKRGMPLPPWTKRWFGVCRDGFMYYYIAASDTQPRGNIPVHGAIVQPLGEQEYGGYHGLAIIMNNKKRVLYAPTHDELQAWIHAINVAARTPRGLEPNMRLPASAGHGSSAGVRGEAAARGAAQPSPPSPSGHVAQSDHADSGGGGPDSAGAGAGDGSGSDDGWEVDEDGYRVRRRKPAAATRGAGGRARAGGHTSTSNDDGELGAHAGHVRDGEGEGAFGDSFGDGDAGDGSEREREGEGEEDEFRPAFQIKIRSAEEAKEGTTADLKTAAAAFKMSAPFAPPPSRSRRVPPSSVPPAQTAPPAQTGATPANSAAAFEPEPFAADWGASQPFPPPTADAFGGGGALVGSESAGSRADQFGDGGSGGGSPAHSAPVETALGRERERRRAPEH